MPAVIVALVLFFIWEGVVPMVGDHLLYDEKFGDKAIQEIEYKLDTLGYNYDNLHTLRTDSYQFVLSGITKDGTKRVTYRAHEVMYYFDIDKEGHISDPHVYRKGRMTSYLRIGMSGEFSPEMVAKKKKKEEELAKEAELTQDRERALEYDQTYNRGEPSIK